MSFSLGLITGIGQAMHEQNTRDYHAQLESEHNANQNTLDMLKGMMSNDSVDPETKNAALQSYMQFTQTKGMPTAKHRQQALEPVLQQFGRKRPGPGVQQLESLAQDTEQQPPQPQQYTDRSTGQTTDLTAVNPAIHAQTIRKVEGMVPERSGFMRPDEVGQIKGRASGIQARTMLDELDMDDNDGSFGIVPDAKNGFRALRKIRTRENYQRPDGSIGERIVDHSTGMGVDTSTGEPAIGPKWAPGSNRIVPGTNADNTHFIEPINSLTGKPSGPRQDVGVKETSAQLNSRTLRNENTAVRIKSGEIGNEVKNIQAYGTYTDGSIPTWMPTTRDQNGNTVPVPGASAKFVFNQANNKKAQAALQTTNMIDVLQHHMANIKQKFGTFPGTIEELLSKYVEDPDVRAIAPIIHEHLPSALSGMYGFKSYESKKDYGEAITGAFHTFLGQPLANVEAALASTREIAQNALNEATNPAYQTAPVNPEGGKGAVPTRTTQTTAPATSERPRLQLNDLLQPKKTPNPKQ